MAPDMQTPAEKLAEIHAWSQQLCARQDVPHAALDVLACAAIIRGDYTSAMEIMSRMIAWRAACAALEGHDQGQAA